MVHDYVSYIRWFRSTDKTIIDTNFVHVAEINDHTKLGILYKSYQWMRAWRRDTTAAWERQSAQHFQPQIFFSPGISSTHLESMQTVLMNPFYLSLKRGTWGNFYHFICVKVRLNKG